MNEIKLVAGKEAQNSVGWACDRRRRLGESIRGIVLLEFSFEHPHMALVKHVGTKERFVANNDTRITPG